jgi:hypothetical protein
MSESPDHPHVRALLGELLQLDEQDRELPLTVLINLHRTQLRAPLERVPQLGREDIGRALKLLAARWPVLTDGQLYRQQPRLLQLREAHVRQPEWYMDRLITRPDLDGLLNILLIGTGLSHGWDECTSAVLLYELTLGEIVRDSALETLELALGLHPAVGQSLVELAALSPEALWTMAEARSLGQAEGDGARARLIRLWRRGTKS